MNIRIIQNTRPQEFFYEMMNGTKKLFICPKVQMASLFQNCEK